MTDPWNIQRFIFECEPCNFSAAAQAANWILEAPAMKHGIIAHREGKHEVSFYVKRNKASISIRQNHKP